MRKFDAEAEREAYEDLSLEELQQLAEQQLAEQNPEPVDPVPSGRNTDNQGFLGRVDGTIMPDRMQRSPLLSDEPPLREIDPGSHFWTSSAVPRKPRK
jgi:hypothetical protein